MVWYGMVWYGVVWHGTVGISFQIEEEAFIEMMKCRYAEIDIEAQRKKKTGEGESGESSGESSAGC